MRRKNTILITLILCFCLTFLSACDRLNTTNLPENGTVFVDDNNGADTNQPDGESQEQKNSNSPNQASEDSNSDEQDSSGRLTIQQFSGNENDSRYRFDISKIPVFSGEPYVVINENRPAFQDTDYIIEAFEFYSELDSLGRCGVAFANICKEIMPTEERESIGSVKPSGWHTVKYDVIEDTYLYNRCHLIGFQLAGENANEKNLITGTRYMNVEGMLPFENMIADYVDETGNHVLYRVTPIFEGNNLVATGVEMEAASVEDKGEGLCFHVFVYNNQPGIVIDYATGESELSKEADVGSADGTSDSDSGTNSSVQGNNSNEQDNGEGSSVEGTYILNINSNKIHLPTCSGVKRMQEKNKKEYTGNIEELIEDGYEPCGACNP